MIIYMLISKFRAEFPLKSQRADRVFIWSAGMNNAGLIMLLILLVRLQLRQYYYGRCYYGISSAVHSGRRNNNFISIRSSSRNTSYHKEVTSSRGNPRFRNR